MQYIPFTMTHLLRSTLALNDDLGFKDAVQAAQAILNNKDWKDKFRSCTISESDAEILDKWRNETLKINNK